MAVEPGQRIGFLIGVDGGGTGTRARVVAIEGKAVGNGEAGPSGLGQGVAQAWRHIEQAIAAAFRDAGLMQPAAPGKCAIGLGLAGVNVPSRAQAFLRIAPAYAGIALDSDAYAALLGAHGAQPGAIVAAGT